MPAPLLFANRLDAIKRVREAFDEAGYMPENVQEAVGKEGFTY